MQQSSQQARYEMLRVKLSHLNQPPTLAPLLSAARIWWHSVRGHVHMTSLKIDMWNSVLVCGPMKFHLIKPCYA